jgi:hypothetical protein
MFSISASPSVVPRVSKTFWLQFSRRTQDTADLVEAWHQLARDLSGIICQIIQIFPLEIFVLSNILYYFVNKARAATNTGRKNVATPPAPALYHRRPDYNAQYSWVGPVCIKHKV